MLQQHRQYFIILLLLLVYFRTLYSAEVKKKNFTAPQSIEPFGEWIGEFFEEVSKFSSVKEALDEVKKNIDVDNQLDPIGILRKATGELNELVKQRVTALQKLVQSAEEVTEHIFTNQEELDNINSTKDRCNKYYTTNMTKEEVLGHSNESTTGFHITLESYMCDTFVIRDHAWTTHKRIEQALIENNKTTLGRQYIGTYSGLTLLFPKKNWTLFPEKITVDLFDPRFRPWFIAAESVPKDILFLIDMSGSVTGPTSHLIRSTLKFILSLLTPNDYFYAIHFASNYGEILETGKNFLPATTSNKKTFDEALYKLEPNNQAMFSAPLNASLDILRYHGYNKESTRESTFKNIRSEGHKLLVIFTDGVDDWPTDVLDKEFSNYNKELIRIFGYSMGFGTNELPLQKYMACKSRGEYSEINSIEDVKPMSRIIMDKLSRVRGKSLNNTTATGREPSWTHLYMDAQAGGPMVTLSLPILTKSTNAIWKKQLLAGVAAIDVHISEFTRHLPMDSNQVYAFIVDNNGIIIYHPKLRLPKSEAHCVRRSACYDSQTSRHRNSHNQRVQHGMSDERVYRLIGLIDSIPTMDMYDLEGNSTSLQDLRRKIITNTCRYDAPIHETDRKKTFNCALIQKSPFTLVIVNTTDLHMGYEKDTELEIPLKNNLITFFYGRRFDCNWYTDKLNKTERFEGFLNISKSGEACSEELRLDRALVKGIEAWAKEFPNNSDNTYGTQTHCLQIPNITSYAYHPHYSNSFVHLRSKATASYPACADSSMKEVGKKFDEEIYSTDHTEDIDFSVLTKREKKDGLDQETLKLVMYKTISHANQRLAVVGVQWKEDFFQKFLEEFIKNRTDWDLYYSRDRYYSILTKEAYVIASNKRKKVKDDEYTHIDLPVHIIDYDPQVALYLIKNNYMTFTTEVDKQSECTPLKTSLYSSASPASSSILKYLVTSLFKLLKFGFWKNMYESIFLMVNGQAEFVNGKCIFQKVVPFERCAEITYRYSLHPSPTQISTSGDMPRFAKLDRIPNTTLLLMQTDISKSAYNWEKDDAKLKNIWKTLEKGPKPRRLETNETISSYQRRAPDVLKDWKSENQSDEQCDTSLTTTNFHPFLFTLMSFFAFSWIHF